jgi:hypothetical protein
MSPLKHQSNAARRKTCVLQHPCHRGLGMLYAQIGQREQAHTELATAIELYRTMEMTFWLPQAEAAPVQTEAR